MKQVLALIISAVGFSMPASAQSWHGLEPMRSTCKDVERVLRVSACGKKSVQSVVEDYTVTIVFSKHECHEKWPHETYGVPAGTVTHIILIPRHPNRVLLSDLGVDASSFLITPVPDHLDAVEYSSTDLGLRFTASKEGEISDIKYFPASTYDHLRCSSHNQTPRSSEPSPILIGAYDPHDPQWLRASEKLFADVVSKFRLAFSGAAPSAKGVTQICIVAYAGRRSRVGGAKRSATLAKQYLIRQYHVDRSSILEIDGGFMEEAQVELFLRPPGAALPTPRPTVHPKDVIFID